MSGIWQATIIKATARMNANNPLFTEWHPYWNCKLLIKTIVNDYPILSYRNAVHLHFFLFTFDVNGTDRTSGNTIASDLLMRRLSDEIFLPEHVVDCSHLFLHLNCATNRLDCMAFNMVGRVPERHDPVADEFVYAPFAVENEPAHFGQVDVENTHHLLRPL